MFPVRAFLCGLGIRQRENINYLFDLGRKLCGWIESVSNWADWQAELISKNEEFALDLDAITSNSVAYDLMFLTCLCLADVDTVCGLVCCLCGLVCWTVPSPHVDCPLSFHAGTVKTQRKTYVIYREETVLTSFKSFYNIKTQIFLLVFGFFLVEMGASTSFQFSRCQKVSAGHCGTSSFTQISFFSPPLSLFF